MKHLFVLSIFVLFSIFYFSDVSAQRSGMSITATADGGSDTISITGKTVTDISDVIFRVLSPSGNNAVAIVQVSPDTNGKFVTEFKIGEMWIEDGFYKITAMQAVQQNSLYTLNVTVEVINGVVAQNTFVTESNLETGIILSNVASVPVSVWTDKTDYAHNEMIMVVGQVANVVSGFPVTITVISPLNSIVTIDKLTVANDGSFETTLNTAGNMWKYDGTYTIQANYQTAETNRVKVVLSGGVEYTPNYSTPQSFTQESLIPTVDAQIMEESISVKTDKSSYSEGEAILISGQVHDLYSGTPVSVIGFSPKGENILIAQLEVGADKKFNTEITAGGALMKYSGTYTITAQYGTVNRSATTSFYFNVEILEPIQTFFTIKPDANFYTFGDIIKISGSIKPLADHAQTVTVVTVGPEGNIVTISQVIPSSDGTFSTTLKAGATMQYDGEYEIRAQYGAQKVTSSFNYASGDATPEPEPTPEPIPEPEDFQIVKSLYVQTDKSFYSEGDTIVITGEVRDLYSGIPVSVIVKAPNGNLVSIAKLEVGADKKFFIEMTAGGALMKSEGTYAVTAQYGTASRSDTTYFEFEGAAASVTQPSVAQPSLCGAGTFYDEQTNSCKLNQIEPEIDYSLQQKITQLKIENKQLKNQINTLQLKIDDFQNVILEQIKVIMDILVESKKVDLP